MVKQGFDNDKYLQTQSAHIRMMRSRSHGRTSIFGHLPYNRLCMSWKATTTETRYGFHSLRKNASRADIRETEWFA